MKQRVILEPETPQEWVDHYAEQALKMRAQIRKEEQENGIRGAFTGTLNQYDAAIRMLGIHYLDLKDGGLPSNALPQKVYVRMINSVHGDNVENSPNAFLDEKQAKKGENDVVGYGFHVVELTIAEPLNTSK